MVTWHEAVLQRALNKRDQLLSRQAALHVCLHLCPSIVDASIGRVTPLGSFHWPFPAVFVVQKQAQRSPTFGNCAEFTGEGPSRCREVYLGIVLPFLVGPTWVFFSTNHVAKAVQLMPCQVRFRSRKFCIQLQHSFHLLGMLSAFVAEYQKVRGTA